MSERVVPAALVLSPDSEATAMRLYWIGERETFPSGSCFLPWHSPLVKEGRGACDSRGGAEGGAVLERVGGGGGDLPGEGRKPAGRGQRARSRHDSPCQCGPVLDPCRRGLDGEGAPFRDGRMIGRSAPRATLHIWCTLGEPDRVGTASVGLYDDGAVGARAVRLNADGLQQLEGLLVGRVLLCIGYHGDLGTHVIQES